jgi:hypothetical protein
MDNFTDRNIPSANIDSNLIGLDRGRRVGIAWLTQPAQIALTNNRLPNKVAALKRGFSLKNQTGGKKSMRTILTAVLVGVLVFGMAAGAIAQTKESGFPDLKREQMNDAQRRVYDEIAGSRGSVRG